MVSQTEDGDPMPKSVQALFNLAMPVKPVDTPIVRNGKPVGLDGFEELNVDALEAELRLEDLTAKIGGVEIKESQEKRKMSNLKIYFFCVDLKVTIIFSKKNMCNILTFEIK